MTAHVDRYAVPALELIWSEEAKLESWVQFEAACSRAQRHGWDPAEVDRHELRGDAVNLEREYGHDVAAFVEALRSQLKPEAARWLHYGLVSSDVVDYGYARAIKASTDQLTIRVGGLSTALVAAMRVFDGLPLAARTHGRLAVPSTFDRPFFAWSDRLLNASDRMRVAVKATQVVGLAGPVGWDRGTFGERAARQVRETLKLRAPIQGTQATPRGEYLPWVQAVAALASVCEHIALQIRLLSQSGVDELAEGRGPEYRGSSSMPHKRNPTRSERVCGLAHVVRGLASAYAEVAAAWWDAHSLEHSAVDRVVLPQVVELTAYLLEATTQIVDELEYVGTGPTIDVDTFRARNELIVGGLDGGDAWRRVHDG